MMHDITAYARYRIEPGVLDLLPIGTFLINCGAPGSDDPTCAMRLVKPVNPDRYPASKLTPGGRLLYYFWSHTGCACKKLGMAASAKTWRWIVQPGQPGFDELDGFKILCDHKRGRVVDTALLYRALGLT